MRVCILYQTVNIIEGKCLKYGILTFWEHILKKWEQGDLDIYFGRWEHWADRRFWDMGAPSEK